MYLALPVKKSVNISNMITALLQKHSCTIRELAQVIGKLVAACPAITYGWAHVKILEHDKYTALKNSKGKYNKKLTLSELARKTYISG